MITVADRVMCLGQRPSFFVAPIFLYFRPMIEAAKYAMNLGVRGVALTAYGT